MRSWREKCFGNHKQFFQGQQGLPFGGGEAFSSGLYENVSPWSWVSFECVNGAPLPELDNDIM